jgi:hypothetical protein
MMYLKKLVRLIGLTITNTTAKVKIGDQLTKEFRIVTGVKQGDPPIRNLVQYCDR